MKLILINGPAGIGKSTVAKRLHADLPLSLLIDIDETRRQVAHYQKYREESYELSFKLALAQSKAHLESGHHVIIDKMILHSKFTPDDFVKLGSSCGAEIFEIILDADKKVLNRRAALRGFKPGGSLTPEKVEQFWEAIQELKKERPHAKVVDTSNRNAEDVYSAIKSLVFH